MDNFRHYKAPRRSVNAVDGFVSSGARQRNGVRQSQIGSSAQPRLDAFARTEGFRPNKQPTVRTSSRVASQTPPSAMRMSPAEMTLPGSDKKRKGRVKRSVPRWKRVLMACFLVVFVGGLLGGGYFGGKAYLAARGILKGGGNAPALAKSIDITKLKGEGDGRINILLLGIGGAGHEGPDLTDTMMLASIDPVNKKAALLSIPRDLWVKLPNEFIASEHKINAAYESGKYQEIGRQEAGNGNKNAVKAGFKAVDGVVETVLNVPVHYNVLLDFHAFEQAINTVDGVSVNVPEALVDPTMAWENGYNPVLAAAGQQNMNGKKALMYVRSRETSSDFARSERQRAVMVALKDKVFSLGTLSNPAKISSLISAFGDNVVSDFSVADAARLTEIMKDVANDKIQSVGLTDKKANLVTTTTINGLSAVQPRAGRFDYSEIQNYARNILVDGFIESENANIAVYNGSTTAGLAGKKAEDLKSYGYNITAVANAPKQDYAQTVIVDVSNGQKKVTKRYLEQRFGVTTVTAMPDATIPTTGVDFVIILGQNEKTN